MEQLLWNPAYPRTFTFTVNITQEDINRWRVENVNEQQNGDACILSNCIFREILKREDAHLFANFKLMIHDMWELELDQDLDARTKPFDNPRYDCFTDPQDALEQCFGSEDSDQEGEFIDIQTPCSFQFEVKRIHPKHPRYEIITGDTEWK